MSDSELHKIRLRVHIVLGVALLASVAANVLAAEPTVVARCVAAWPPVALLLVVDVLGRVPLASGLGGRLAAAAAGLVALVAAVASFSHVRHVALQVGESELVAWILPLSVDGLAVVCSVGLVEINRRLRTSAVSVDPMPAAAPASVPQMATASEVHPVSVPLAPSAEPVSLNGSSPIVWA